MILPHCRATRSLFELLIVNALCVVFRIPDGRSAVSQEKPTVGSLCAYLLRFVMLIRDIRGFVFV